VLSGNNAGCRTAPTSYSIADSWYQVMTTSDRPAVVPGWRHFHAAWVSATLMGYSIT